MCALHRVFEYVHAEYTKVNDFIFEMKKVLLKAHVRIQIYLDVTRLPLQPLLLVLTGAHG